MKLPITSPLNHPNSFCGGMFKLNAKFDTDSLLYSLSHFECDGHTVHMLTQRHLRPYWIIVQWSYYSHMCIPVHSPWLLGYINVTQTVLGILTMARLFQTDLVYRVRFQASTEDLRTYPPWIMGHFCIQKLLTKIKFHNYDHSLSVWGGYTVKCYFL